MNQHFLTSRFFPKPLRFKSITKLKVGPQAQDNPVWKVLWCLVFTLLWQNFPHSRLENVKEKES